MATVRLRDAPKLWSRRERRLKREQKVTPLRAAKRMQSIAKKLAPRGTGETIRGIRRRKVKNGWVVESLVRGRFKQNLFANRTAPFRTLRFVKNNRFFRSPQSVVYGRGGVSSGGNPIRWTGTPRFWHFASLRMRKKYGRQALKNTRKALRTAF